MHKILTLSLDSKIIERAKQYANANKTSLSKMIEVYLDLLTKNDDSKGEIDITPLVQSLCGVTELPKNFDYKKFGSEYLIEK